MIRYLSWLPVTTNIRIVKRVLVGARVYARMSPDQKAMLVKELQDETGENVGMCGDGANDCKALKVADVGLSLSEAEASIAAPFTSNVQNISSSVELLKLGRFSLDISYSLIQVMFMYTCIQFTCLIFTYYFASKISDFQYVYVDICCLMPITLFICWIDPKPELIEFYPPNSLLDPRVFISIIGHMIVTISGIIGIYFCLIHQSFYIPIVKSAANKSGKFTDQSNLKIKNNLLNYVVYKSIYKLYIITIFSYIVY